jgi:putative salt-induced outer membrane protein YdiY
MYSNSLFQAGRSLLFLALAIIGLLTASFAKSTDDVVMLKNGDHLTGEIKSLEHGELTFKSVYMIDSVRLDWNRVARLESKDQYIVLLSTGHVFTAQIRLQSPAATGRPRFRLQTSLASLYVNPLEVSSIRPVDRGFWKQLVGTVDFGLSYNSGNRQYQAQLGASVVYRKEGHEATADMSSVFSGQSGGSSARRNTFNSQYRKLFQRKWFYGGIVDLLSSEEQSLDLRSSLGGVFGRRFIQTNRSSLSAFTGIAGSRERYALPTGSSVATNADLLLGLDYATYRFRTLEINSRLLLWKSLTDSGRVRINLNSNFRVELAKNLFWNLNLYENFDNKPPINAKKNDLGVSVSLGWKY